MIISVYHLQLGMIRIYTFSDSMRHTKIKGSTGHRKIFSCNTFLIIVWSKTICVYPKLLVLHAFRKISRNIKKRMMRKIKYRGCIRSCLVCQIQRIIILTKTIDQRHFQVSGETIFSIRREIRQTDLCVSACSTFHILSAKPGFPPCDICPDFPIVRTSLYSTPSSVKRAFRIRPI